MLSDENGAMSWSSAPFETLRGWLANIGRQRAKGKRAWLGTIGFKDITCHHAMLIRRDDEERHRFPILVHMQRNGIAFSPHDQPILPGDEIRWHEREIEHAAWVLDTVEHGPGHKKGGPAPFLSIPDHKRYLLLLIAFAPPETRTSWTVTIGPIIDSVVVINLPSEMGLDRTTSALLSELLRRVDELSREVEIVADDRDKVQQVLDDIHDALLSTDRSRLRRALAVAGSVSVGAAGSGAWDGVRALAEAMLRHLR